MASSSSSSAPSAAAFSSQSWSYDVFLSFRGEDTRKTFVDHLYTAIVRQGIHTYKDDQTLPRGESIGPSLLKAIEESQMAVIIFSTNYANSSWCLDELAHIMKCKDKTGQIVMPVFYGVDPSEVRKQTKKYGKAFFKHMLVNRNKVKSWKKALEEAGNLSGWEPKKIANGHESKAIKEIVDKISSRLQLATASANEDLVGISARVQRLKEMLQVGSGGVRMVGIWGVGGGGKTTLATAVYNEIYRQFDGCCLMANIREESTRRGLEELQEKILSKTGANCTGGGGSLISQRLRNRKVLIVLDDVDQLEQLEVLAGSPLWFGEGSRVIITTRDEHLLNAHKVVVHDVSLLQDDEAIELFRKYAQPRSSIPMEDHEKLSKEVVAYARGLPLALKVLGSSLCDKTVEQWESALERLKKIPENKILDKLRISFDGLTKEQKVLFLDIACFHRGWTPYDPMERLDACGFNPVIGVEELRQKALITISEDGTFDMHDLVQEMRHYIVREEHPNNPEKHSRVWKKEDVLRICAMDATKELDNIQAIQVPIGNYPPPLVANMRNLRYIQWFGEIGSPLLNNFPPTELCCLILREATQERLWNGYKDVPNLKMMELSELPNLRMTPIFDGILNLEIFKLLLCPILEEVDSSLGGLVGLVSLEIEHCKGIKKFPSITRLEKLETLSFHYSPGLFELSEIQQKMESLGDEDISRCSAVLELSKMNNIQLCFFHRNLRRLDLSGCKLGDEETRSAVWELPNLQVLCLSYNEFSRLNFSLMRIPRLKWLNVSYCTELVELSELPSSIAELDAHYCESLETIGDISNCKWLWKVELHGAKKIGPVDCYMLLKSMLKGNAIGDHHVSISLPHQITEWGIVGMLFMGNTNRMRLPHDWSNHFSGFLIHVVTSDLLPEIDIMMKEEEGDEDSPFELHHESNQAPGPGDNETYKFVGYVSFNSLGLTACMISTYNGIEISLHHSEHYFSAVDRIGGALVPRKSKDGPTQTTNLTTHPSQYLDDHEVDYGKTFSIERDSKSSVKISWQPNR